MKKDLCINTAIFLLLAFAITSCKKGDTGPAGEQGPQGPQGIQGNANVTQYNFGAQNFLTSTFSQLQITTTQDTMNNSSWLVYLYNEDLARWYFIPGLGVGGDTQYRISMGYTTKVNLYIDKKGTGENYSKAKVIRIYSSNIVTTNSGSGSPADLDLSDYEEVRTYYHLPE